LDFWAAGIDFLGFEFVVDFFVIPFFVGSLGFLLCKRDEMKEPSILDDHCWPFSERMID
jgi:hypothetical protein